MKSEEIFRNIIYGILLSVFLILYFILSVNSRLVADDFYFLKNLEEHGWFPSMLLSWDSWITRWASILWLNAIFILYSFTGNFLFFYIVTLLMLCFALYRFSSFAMDFFISNWTARSQGIMAMAGIPRSSKFAVLLLISFFILTTGQGEVFFWATSSAMYLWGFIAVCFLLAELFKERPSFASVLVCIITAAFAGGAAEAISIPAFIILVIFLAFRLKRKKFVAVTAISAGIIFISIAISYLGGGRALRQSALPDVSLLHAFSLSASSLVQIELFFLREKILFIVLFYFAWVGFGTRLPFSTKINFKLIAWILAAYLVLCFIFVFPTVYLLGEIPPHRARIFIGFLNCCMVAVSGLITATYFRKPQITLFLSSAAALTLVVLIGKMAMEQKQITSGYASSVDKRMQKLSSNETIYDNAVIVLEPLPGSGLLLSSEISTDSTDFRNKHLKNYLKISNEIVLKK